MAWYDANRNRDQQAYLGPKPGYGGIAYPDYAHRQLIDGREAIVGFSATHESQNYVTEQVVELRRFPVIGDHENNPKRKELYKDPWNPARDQHEKAHDYSPKFGNQVIHGQNKGSPGSNGYRGNSPPSPWSSARDQPEKAHDYSPKFGNQVIHGQNKGSPRSNVYKGNSPPSRNHHPFYTTHDYGKYNNHSGSDDDEDDDDDDITCHDGVCYKNNKGGTKPNLLKEEVHDKEKHKGNGYSPLAQPRKDSYYETPYADNKEKHKGNNGYAPPSYTLQPIKDTYYEASNPNHNNDQKHKGNNNGYVVPHSYTVPLTTPPRKDTYHDQNRPNLMSNPPPPIRTRADTNRAGEFPSENTKSNSPVSLAARQPPLVSSSPKKLDHGYNYKETIDSAEARRRYGGAASPRAGARGEEKYKGTIDSIQAAKKYNGVFVPT